jgi:hypothetical protein
MSHYSRRPPRYTAHARAIPSLVLRSARLITWLRCEWCHRGYVASGAPDPQACPACTGGRLLPVGLWDLAHEAAPVGMLWREGVA